MTLFKQVWALVRKEFLIEWRYRSAINGIFLYVFSTVFLIYIAFNQIQSKAWNVLFWIVILFASVNAVAKSFVQENSARQLYYYTLVHPIALLLSKMIYNTLLLLIIGVLNFASFYLVAGNPVLYPGQFVLAYVVGVTALSLTITFVSAISVKANNSATLISVLSFPLVVQILLVLIKISANAIGIIQDSAIWNEFLILFSINLLLLGISLLLFPFVWRD